MHFFLLSTRTNKPGANGLVNRNILTLLTCRTLEEKSIQVTLKTKTKRKLMVMMTTINWLLVPNKHNHANNELRSRKQFCLQLTTET